MHVSPENLVTITGGKWTTQRAMGEAAVDKAIEVAGLESVASKCKTPFVKLIGAHKWDHSYFTFLAQRYEFQAQTEGSPVAVASNLLDVEVAKHLATAYGDQAYKVAELAQGELATRLVHGQPILCAEIVHCIRNEYCLTAVDFLARRTRLAFLARAPQSRAAEGG